MVKRALEGLKGVKKAEVSFERAEAIVTYEQGRATLKEMMRAVEQYGFKAKPK